MVSAAEERTFCDYSLATCVYVEAVVNPFTAEGTVSALGRIQVFAECESSIFDELQDRF